MKPKTYHYGWIVIAMGLLTTIAAHGFGRMSYTIILPAMKDGLSFSYTQLGLLGTGNFIGYLSMAFFGGILASRFGARIVIATALVTMGLTMMMTGLSQTFAFAFAMRLATGLGNGAAFVPAMALASAWFSPAKRGFATGIVSAGIGSGTLISGLLVPPILSGFGHAGWRISWYLLGAAVTLIGGVVFAFIRNRPEDLGLVQIGGAPQPAKGRGSPAEAKGTAPGWSTLYRRFPMWYLGVIYFFFGLSYIIYMIFFAAYLEKEMGFSARWAGNLWALVGGLSIFCGVIWGAISDRLGRNKGAALAYLVLALAYGVYAVTHVKFGFYVSAILFGLSAWSIPTIMAAAAGDVVGPRLSSAGLGFITLFFGVGQALGPALGGYLADSSRSFTLPFLTAAAISTLGALFSIFFKATDSRR